MTSIPRMQIGFLFNHDCIHQIAHTAPIICELVALGQDVSVVTSCDAQERQVRAIIAGCAARVRFIHIDISRLSRAINVVAKAVLPFRRIANLRENVGLFARFDALVVPETTSALLRSHFNLDVRLVYLPHGAGDRAIGFRDVTRFFDLVLLPGTKTRDRMLAGGLVRPGHHAVIGYPKFDIIDMGARPRFFDNDRPTVLYNPHFDPVLSSWWDMGLGVLEWFARQDDYNLIFAPHVMLFRRWLHTSVEHRRIRCRWPIPERLRNLSHILIDTGSTRSVDMSYVLAADIYLGDASSQVYEWICNPRPCIFLNSHGARWQGNPSYAHWNMGQVIDRVSALPRALAVAQEQQAAFARHQRAAFAATFHIEAGGSAARRAAREIVYYLLQDKRAAA
ncbi:hypothetical protein [Komagataeibacter rhaeticus]|uniref:Uncharacterized protein n=1 Tax=Komagataeibacter rhaeticus TaxID=215221 RepID=A0A181CBK1_9PROT|nr:hypothetical protein [Komagataeibacter rhaeticus]ATU72405.1 hypothetical protein CT154_05715 [Komagataeibacter xylinus]QIP35686.1 hypothetical protein GWK63_09595 [Komagataeibacter rhaeticus]QOC45443.1 hypothetical protein ICJ78_09640 [Komagataeibacter rhaeticus]WPP22147.1 hypothetical protein SCD25_01215 [Komagataeibacter rhaeticus]SAY48947.1 hypothetical protein KRIGEM_01901 [Komagataeibacter rhaeticus]